MKKTLSSENSTDCAFFRNAWTRSWSLIPRARTALSLALTLGAVAMLVSALAATQTSSPAQTFYQYNSQPGDYIGAGGSNSYTPANATIGVIGSAEYLRFTVQTATESWDVFLAAPAGEQLHPAIYYNAERADFRTGRSPGLDVSGDGRGCNEVWGNFAVNQVATDASGNITLLDATFTQQCESATAPLLQGIVKFNALPLSYSFVSDPGDYIGQGETKSYEGATSLFFLGGTNTGVGYSVSGERDNWNVGITPPTGQQLRVHSYKTKRSADKSNASLDVSGDGRGCNTSTGTLNITAITFDAQGNVTSLNATFEQHCEGGTPALKGTIHYYQ
jgi:hypothetical protein